MNLLMITVETDEQADELLDVLGDAELELDFSFGIKRIDDIVEINEHQMTMQ